MSSNTEPKDTSSRAADKAKGSRYRARKHAVEILFEAEMRDMDPVDISSQRAQQSKEDPNGRVIRDYTMTLVEGVATTLDHLDATIGSHLNRWNLDRIPDADRAILRVGAWEVAFGSAHCQPATAIAQALLLADEFGTDDSAKYINAVLDAIAKNADKLQQADAALQALDAMFADHTGADTQDTANDFSTPEGSEDLGLSADYLQQQNTAPESFEAASDESDNS